MSDEKEKYSDGTSLDASTMSKQEKIKAIGYWCEGNQQLKQLLLYCDEKDIETIGCCSGHEVDDGYAYIAMKLGSSQDNQIIDLLVNLEISNADINVGFIRGVENRRFCVLASQEIRK